MKLSYNVFMALCVTMMMLQSGCLAIKTQHEVQPIHITMDVNLKVDKAVEESISTSERTPSKYWKETKALFDAKLIGLTNKGYWEKRGELTAEQEQMLELANAERTQRYAELAEKTNSTLSVVQKKHAARYIERIPVGKGVWYQDEAGEWQTR